MKKLSKFDITMIVVFVAIGLLGGGAWYYLSTLLSSAQEGVTAAKADFDKYSSKEVYLPTTANQKILETNIDLMKGQLEPLIHSKLQPDNSKLISIANKDTLAWKHDLDAEVLRLNTAAKLHGVKVPNNFYYGFSHYLSVNPMEEKTAVLSKQLLAIEQIADILINAPVKGIQAVRRTYEEDAPSTTSGGNGSRTDESFLSGNAIEAPGGAYISYPFEIEFEATTDSLRKIINDLTQSPYVFVVRVIAVHNSRPDSPQVGDLDKMAETPSSPVGDSSPGEVAATQSSKGPQYLFGGETLRVAMR
jgi:hypothetical protein